MAITTLITSALSKVRSALKPQENCKNFVVLVALVLVLPIAGLSQETGLNASTLHPDTSSETRENYRLSLKFSPAPMCMHGNGPAQVTHYAEGSYARHKYCQPPSSEHPSNGSQPQTGMISRTHAGLKRNYHSNTDDLFSVLISAGGSAFFRDTNPHSQIAPRFVAAAGGSVQPELHDIYLPTGIAADDANGCKATLKNVIQSHALLQVACQHKGKSTGTESSVTLGTWHQLARLDQNMWLWVRINRVAPASR